MKIRNDSNIEIKEQLPSGIRFRIKPGEIKIVDNGLGAQLKWSGCIEIKDTIPEPEEVMGDEEIEQEDE